MSAKITVITPTYNRAHTLERVYNSLKNQTFKDFIWLIMDDGSTDQTKELTEKFQAENQIEIQYFKQENQHKFLTVLDGIRKVETPYHIIADSDDEYPENAFEVLFDEAEKIENQNEFIGVMGLSIDEKGKIVGDKYPGNGFDGSIFDMRYKYKVRGDKFGIFITETYLKQIENKDYTKYSGKGYIPQSVIFNEYDAKGIKTRFINQNVRVYHKDENDVNSVSNTRWNGKNVYGLAEGYLSFLNAYRKKLYFYPKTLIRNLIGYQFYALAIGQNLIELNKNLKHFTFLSLLVFPFSYIYHKLKFFGG